MRLGDTLSWARPPGWSHRARRAYDKAFRILTPEPAGRTSTVQYAALRVHAIANERRSPVTGAALRLGIALGVAVAAVAALLWVTVPRFRAFVAPKDLAERAAWEASSGFGNFSSRGFGPRGTPTFFHTAAEGRPWLRLDLPREALVSTIVVDNRSDCCSERALPLNVEILDGSDYRLVCQRRAAFTSFTCRFPAARTRAVRVTLPGGGILHLSGIAVFE
jgi:hypothetical protein